MRSSSVAGTHDESLVWASALAVAHAERGVELGALPACAVLAEQARRQHATQAVRLAGTGRSAGEQVAVGQAGGDIAVESPSLGYADFYNKYALPRYVQLWTWLIGCICV